MWGAESDGETEKKVKVIETRMTAFLTGIREWVGVDMGGIPHLTASSKLMSQDGDGDENDEQQQKGNAPKTAGVC